MSGEKENWVKAKRFMEKDHHFSILTRKGLYNKVSFETRPK